MVEPFSVNLIESIAPFQYFTLGICLKIFFLSHFIFNHLTFNIVCFKYSNIQSQKKCDYKSKSLRWCDQRSTRLQFCETSHHQDLGFFDEALASFKLFRLKIFHPFDVSNPDNMENDSGLCSFFCHKNNQSSIKIKTSWITTTTTTTTAAAAVAAAAMITTTWPWRSYRGCCCWTPARAAQTRWW